MKDFWVGILEDLVFEHCDGQGLKPVFSEYVSDDYRMELDPDGFTLYSNDDLSNDTLSFHITDGKLFTSENWALESMIGPERYKSLETIVRMVVDK